MWKAVAIESARHCSVVCEFHPILSVRSLSGEEQKRDFVSNFPREPHRRRISWSEILRTFFNMIPRGVEYFLFDQFV